MCLDRRLLPLGLVLSLAFGCSHHARTPPAQAEQAESAPHDGPSDQPDPTPQTGPADQPGSPTAGFGFDVAGMDRSVAPGDDFVRYASGTYLQKLVIPPDRAQAGVMPALVDLAAQRARALAEAAAASRDAAPGSDIRKIGDFYSSFMDEAGIEAKGLAPLEPYLDAIRKISDRGALSEAFGAANRWGSGTPLSVKVDLNPDDPERHVIHIMNGTLGLPAPAYYLDRQNAHFAEVRDRYLRHISAMLHLAGVDRAEARARGILDLETRLAKAAETRIEDLPPDQPPVSPTLDKALPGLDLARFLAAAGIQGHRELIFPPFFTVTAASRLIAQEPLETWKDYLAYHALATAAPVLPRAFVDEDFAFSEKVLHGRAELAPRWQRAMAATTRAMGQALGKLYVERHFSPAAREQARQLVQNLVAALDARLSRLAWMAPETRAKARAKLARVLPKIGYPDAWRDYSRLEVRHGDALGNHLRAAEFEYQQQLDQLGKPADRAAWPLSPVDVNAEANVGRVDITVPAAILESPLFDPRADPAVNYGAIGVILAHEICHHFDANGRQFDPDGKMGDWWTPVDQEHYKGLTDRLVQQVAGYEPLPGVHVDGARTLDENIADLAGVAVALDAYHRSLQGRPAKVLGGFTGDQRFFLGFAQTWRHKYREPALRHHLAQDPHTPAAWRPLVVRNLDAWYEAFDVKPGQKLYLPPEERITIW